MQQREANARKAVDFFTRAGLTRLLERLRAKYISEGEVRGQVVLDEATPAERRELASFLNKPAYRDATIRVKLLEIDQALRHSGFACTLVDVITAFRPNEPLETRLQLRAAIALQQADFRQALHTLAAQFPEPSHARLWLLQGIHGIEWLFARYKNMSPEEQQIQLEIIRYVAGLLDQLPELHAPERLALFAQRTCGDPHALDAHTPAGHLFLLALHDFSDDGTSLPPQDRAHELRLYNEVGLLVDTISSSVAVFHLAAATLRSGASDPLPQAAGARVLLIPQRQLLDWSQAQPARADIYGIENPQVFEEVVDTLLRLDTSVLLPTLVCTSGWPSVAALLLLDMLLATPANRFYYSGDFDLKGLQIASALLARYPTQCQPWRFHPDDYLQALQAEGVAARPNDLTLLNTLPPPFASLVAAMQEQKRWAYQEGIAHLLAQDM